MAASVRFEDDGDASSLPRPPTPPRKRMTAQERRAERLEDQKNQVEQALESIASSAGYLKISRPVDDEVFALSDLARLFKIHSIPLSATDDRGHATISKKRVAALNLHGFGFLGDLEKVIAIVSKLLKIVWLRLSNNRISGRIPGAALGGMRSLQVCVYMAAAGHKNNMIIHSISHFIIIIFLRCCDWTAIA